MSTLYLSTSISFPIARGELQPTGNYKFIGDILGTCFSMGGPYFITASHVLEQYKDHEIVIGIANRDTLKYHAVKIIEEEELFCDISIIKVDYGDNDYEKWIEVLSWNRNNLPIFRDVATVGYPHGKSILEDRISLIPRGFKGYITSLPDSFSPIGWKRKPFNIYELSFQIPNQLSGGPLIMNVDHPIITGVVIGNSSSKILVLENEEIIESKKEKTIVQEYNLMTLGIAVRETEILPINSRILGTTISEYLLNRK